MNEESSSSPALPCDSCRLATSSKSVLDAAKRARILALVANGSSRRVAARFVGCAPSTITRTAARDPQFGADLARAEEQVEVEALRAVRAAAKNERYWRAAAWLLERRNPEDYAQHIPGRYNVPQVLVMFAQVLACLGPELSDRPRLQAMEKLKTLLIEVDGGTEPEKKA